jgi:hypothetical protein
MCELIYLATHQTCSRVISVGFLSSPRDDEGGMTEQAIGCPLGESDLRHELRLPPAQLLHILISDAFAETTLHAGWHIAK